ncbi:IclR family transcriptional regulator [Psychrobacillus soli]|uniref:IclR family transcriptional regulator n=1 Tax=Psychrobacillus soli TaxID=1543965 RepID=A0A544T4A4_9BACI|nr:IclR family transcriptional regulator [Psychrobacillus soli]TQR12277.1 IclR family transcriptional regulator [Psychrobacillus soli]
MKPNVISKTFSLLRAFTDGQSEWGVNELARFLDMPVSSTHRMISTLKDEHILEYSDVTGKYKIGSDFIRMASIISTNVDVKKIARPYLENLAKNLHHSVYFSLYYPQHQKLAFVDCIKSSSALQYVLEIGVLQSIHVAASGKNILAHLSDTDIEEILEKEVDSQNDKELLKNEMKKVKEQGYTKTANERKEGALSIGAPVFDASRKVIGSIICVVPIGDFKESQEEFFIQSVKESAKDISYSLGYPKI